MPENKRRGECGATIQFRRVEVKLWRKVTETVEGELPCAYPHEGCLKRWFEEQGYDTAVSSGKCVQRRNRRDSG